MNVNPGNQRILLASKDADLKVEVVSQYLMVISYNNGAKVEFIDPNWESVTEASPETPKKEFPWILVLAAAIGAMFMLAKVLA